MTTLYSNRPDPAVVMHNAIKATMLEGLKKHIAEGWRKMADLFHLMKAMRHIATAILMINDWQNPDKEGYLGHLRNAGTRIAMVLANNYE